MTVRRRLVLWYSGVLAVSGLALILAVYFLTAHQLRREADKFLRDEMFEMIRLCRERGGSIEEMASVLRAETVGERYFPIICRVYDPAARRDLLVIARPSLRDAFSSEIDPSMLEDGPLLSVVTLGEPRREVRLLATRMGPGGLSSLIFQGGIYVDRLNRRLKALRFYLSGAFASMLFVAVAGGAFLAKRSLNPVDEIIREVERIQSESLSFRLPTSGARDEIERLRTAVNGMLGRLEEAFARIGDFTADAAHELRTPLAALKCRLEVALHRGRDAEEYRQALGDVLAAADRLTRMVNDLLFLARIDAEPGPMERVRMADLLEENREIFGILAEERGIRLEFDCPPDAAVKGNPALLRRLIGNLVDNALRHTPAGGSVSVSVRPEGAACLLEVADTGPGVPPEHRERVFDRFFRGEDERSRHGGAGLGLSICKRVADLHGGTIRFLPRPGGGSLFQAALPVG
jgi:heavy metal sensor kinase